MMQRQECGPGPIETDYLVVGAGAAAMAFVDTLLDGSDASVVMADRRSRCGGHWNDAYPFVRLHQPTAWYGVPSRAVPDDDPDPAGFVRGATGAGVLDYFDRLMQERFLTSGRVRWLPGCEYRRGDDGSHRLVSTVDGSERTVHVRRKLVDATHARTEVPATHGPRYDVASGVDCVPPHRLPQHDRSHGRYVVVGSGKTGMDTVLWLLGQGVPAARIRWIMPRDAWLLDRANYRIGAEHFAQAMACTLGQLEAIAESASLSGLLASLESRGVLLRIDPAVEPTTYRCANVSHGELAELRRVQDVVRLGRVQRLENTRIVLERGTIDADPDALYVDCSAAALQPRPRVPVFDGDVVNLLLVSWCRPMFSAALIAHVENTVSDTTEKNALCAPVGIPERPADWLTMWDVTLANTGRWRQQPKMDAWVKSTRLNAVSTLLNGQVPADQDSLALIGRYPALARAAAANLPRLLATIGPQA
jgi:hypothetical protein